MSPDEQQRLLSALMLATVALFLGSGHARSPKTRRTLRVLAVSLFALVAIVALIRAALWIAQG